MTPSTPPGAVTGEQWCLTWPTWEDPARRPVIITLPEDPAVRDELCRMIRAGGGRVWVRGVEYQPWAEYDPAVDTAGVLSPVVGDEILTETDRAVIHRVLDRHHGTDVALAVTTLLMALTQARAELRAVDRPWMSNS